jgi:hypothetical protein
MREVEWTVDVEKDWGGRADSFQGIEDGLPKILETFKLFHIRATFFISTELTNTMLSDIIKLVKSFGHEVGFHGNHHEVRDDNRILDYLLAKQKFLLNGIDTNLFRGPRFKLRTSCSYSNPKNHVSVLKYSWGLQRVPRDPIFYIHPFDITVPKTKAPNLFCQIVYSRPDRVYENFIKLIIETI